MGSRKGRHVFGHLIKPRSGFDGLVRSVSHEAHPDLLDGKKKDGKWGGKLAQEPSARDVSRQKVAEALRRKR